MWTGQQKRSIEDVSVVSRIPKRITSILGLFIGFFAAILILGQLDLADFAEILANADYRYLLPCFGLYFLGLGARAQRWRVLLADRLPLQRAFNIMNIAYLVNGVLPLRIGEVARIFMTSRANAAIPAMQTGSTILVERLLDVLTVVVMAMLSMAIAPVPAEIQKAGFLGGVLAVGGFGILVVLGRQREFVMKLVSRISDSSGWLRRTGVEKLASDFLIGLSPILEPASMLNALFWTGISWLLSLCTNYVLMLAFFENGDWVAIMLSIATASFAIAIPLVPGNIGTYEASILLAFTILGYNQLDTVAAFALAHHATNVLVIMTVGVIGMIYEGLSLGNLRTQLEQLQDSTR